MATSTIDQNVVIQGEPDLSFTKEEMLEEAKKFSFVRGGPAYRLFRATGLCDEKLEPAYRRAVVITAFAWLPLLLLSVIEGFAFAGVQIPFLYDIETHGRFLVALPVLLASETLIERILSPRIKNFIYKGIVREKDYPQFKAALDWTNRVRDSILPEVIIVCSVYTIGLFFYGAEIAARTATWYAVPDETAWNVTPAGIWMLFVSVPLFQIFLVRAYIRMGIWFVFLWKVSKLDLNLIVTHADHAGGLGFLSKCAFSFSYFLFAQGALLSAYIAGQILYFGADPMSFKLEAAVFAVVFLAFVFLPLVVFSSQMVKAKWQRGGKYSLLVSGYVQNFEDKWIEGHRDKDDVLLGSSDIQSLADLAHSYDIISQMRPTPFKTKDVIYMAAVALFPLAPLVFFVFSIDEVLQKLVGIIF